MQANSMKYNVCVVQPNGYIHSAAFAELAELIRYAIEDLGHAAAISVNRVHADSVNIIIGIHLLELEYMKQIPEGSIVLNTEQLSSGKEKYNQRIFEWVSHFQTWDYSERNLLKLREVGAKAPKLLRIGFHEKLARIPKSGTQDIDVLFYGAMNERRASVVADLASGGLNVKSVFGLYGKERDQLIARSKVVLNLHYYESQIFEIIRVFYLMINSKAVVSEVGHLTSIDSCYLDGISPAPYEDLSKACQKLIREEEFRIELEERSFAAIKKMPQHELIAELLD